MIDPNQANRAHNVASAIAGFQLADFFFATLVKNGILPKAEAEQMLKRLIAANKTGGSITVHTLPCVDCGTMVTGSLSDGTYLVNEYSDGALFGMCAKCNATYHPGDCDCPACREWC